jgi:hypothetical protein
MLGRIPRPWLPIGVAMLSLVGPMVSTAHGASWHLQTVPPAPTQSQGSGQLNGVSCPSSRTCVAVGELGAVEDLGPGTTLGELWNGSSWKQQSTPNVRGQYAQELEGVSCRSVTACTAVGFDTNGSGVGGPLAERYNGKSWSIQRAPADPGALYGAFHGISCPAATGCIAVGSERRGGNEIPIAARWNGSGWVRLSVPMPIGAPDASLAKLSCRSMTWCEAVGRAFGPISESGLAEHFDGRTWSRQSLPAATTKLSGVSCPSTRECFAVGEGSGPGGLGAVADRYNGSAWTLRSTPAVPNADFSSLDSVYCSSARVCSASGWFEATGNQGSSTLAERWTGTRWSIQPTPNAQDPTMGWGNELKAIACPPGTTCESVGYVGSWTGDHGVLPVLAERYS